MALEEWLARNWAEVREQRGLTWAQLAEQCRRAGHEDIARWADTQAGVDKSARAANPTGRAVNRPGKRG